jgi:hypothetical protein
MGFEMLEVGSLTGGSKFVSAKLPMALWTSH